MAPTALRLVAATLVLGAAACRAGFDPVTMDPLPTLGPPPGLEEGLGLRSAGAHLNAILYTAPGPGPHPLVVLLHGFPGNERNLDLAQAIRRAGWSVLFFHYRGAWGSGGRFSFGHVLEDVAAVIARVREPDFAAPRRIDPARIALVGHSMGGFAALVTASELGGVACTVSIAGGNLGAMASAPADPRAAAAMAETLEAWGSGPIRELSGMALLEELRANSERFDLRSHAPRLARQPVLLVAGRLDAVTPLALHHAPLAAAIEAQGGDLLHQALLDSDHAFSTRRIALARSVVGFLGESCGPPR